MVDGRWISWNWNQRDKNNKAEDILDNIRSSIHDGIIIGDGTVLFSDFKETKHWASEYRSTW
ncbi:hypothetical protein [Candidatus Hodgkinia cicadicola]|uniref:hypothetical protein n=1 Tax=Candidatus Hodgkinia cicadicola TaxID=573658 RepID=UPI001788A6B3